MQAFVTGATGFIGGALTRRLVREGWKVRALARPTSDRAGLADLPLEWIIGDVTDPSVVREGVRGVDAVFHCAADVDLIAPARRAMLRTNVQGTRTVLGACRTGNVPRTVYLSSVAAIGLQGDVLGDETTMHPGKYQAVYDESKHLSEQVALEFARHGMDIVLVLPSVVIGPGDPKTGRVFQAYLRRKIPALLRGEGRASYVHIDDLVDGILLAQRKGRSGDRYILSQADLSHTELFARLERITGVPAPRRRVGLRTALAAAGVALVVARLTGREPLLSPASVRLGARRFRYSSEKARRDLGWKPQEFAKRLEETARWWMEQEARRNGS